MIGKNNCKSWRDEVVRRFETCKRVEVEENTWVINDLEMRWIYLKKSQCKEDSNVQRMSWLNELRKWHMNWGNYDEKIDQWKMQWMKREMNRSGWEIVMDDKCRKKIILNKSTVDEFWQRMKIIEDEFFDGWKILINGFFK